VQDPAGKNSFEAAHALLLAIIKAAEKSVESATPQPDFMGEILPWYSQLLLQVRFVRRGKKKLTSSNIETDMSHQNSYDPLTPSLSLLPLNNPARRTPAALTFSFEKWSKTMNQR